MIKERKRRCENGTPPCATRPGSRRGPIYFYLRETVRYVAGAKRAALYDLASGDVYSLNAAGRKILGSIEIERYIPVTDMSTEQKCFVRHLAEIGLGKMRRRKQPRVPQQAPTYNSPKLEFLWLEVTERCNLKCLHCYADSKAAGPNDLDSAFWMRIIDEAVNMGCLKFQFIGGEPLMRRDIFRLIKHARSKGAVFIELFTNGILLNQQIINCLCEQDVQVAVSLYGPNESVHDDIVGVPGSFHRLDHNLRLLRKNKIETRVAVIVMKRNQNHLDALHKYLKGIGFRSRKSDVVRPEGRAAACTLLPTRRDILMTGFITEPNFSTNENRFYWNQRFNSCWAGKAVVKTNGDVGPCIFARDIVVGNVQSERLCACIEKPRLQSLWRITKDSVQKCKRCEYRYACHDCRALALAETGDIHGAYPRCLYNPVFGEWKEPDSIK